MIRKTSIYNPAGSRLILALAIFLNILCLGYFKYLGFFFDVFEFPGDGLGYSNIILPLGISFFTLQQIAFLIDVYEDEIDSFDFQNYCFFVSFFPQLIAGPIVHYRNIICQISLPQFLQYDSRNFAVGIYFISMGLFKKIVLADHLSIVVEEGLSFGSPWGFVDGWLIAISYALQIYFDFSGYCDMALGLGLLCNIRLPINFDRPYLSCSIIEFWQRWHITLSQFITHYIYFPLARTFGVGNLFGSLVATFITMFLAGLWHGASWMFIAFGVWHGLMLMLNTLWRRCGIRLPIFFSWVLTVNVVIVGWIFFRSTSFGDSVALLHALYGPLIGTGADLGAVKLVSDLGELYGLIFGGIFCLIFLIKEPTFEAFYQKSELRISDMVLTVFFLVSSLLFINDVPEFIYFQF